MEWILVSRDEKAIQEWKEKRLALNADIQEFARQLKENNLDLDQTIFEQFISGGSESIWVLLEKQINDDIKRMKITSKIAKSNLLKGINATADGFKPIHAKISTGLSQCGIQAKDITITQGKAILTKEELELKRQQESG
ncbi:unnamed protein product, partial [marine sediment metagenome]